MAKDGCQRQSGRLMDPGQLDRTHPYSSWPAVSRTSSSAISPSIVVCLRYESSIVGSYSSTKCDWMNWIAVDEQRRRTELAEVEAAIARQSRLAGTHEAGERAVEYA